MRTRAKLLHDWNHQLHRLLPGVRSTRVGVLALFTLGVLWAGSVTLLKVAASLPLAAADASTERRVRRWLANRRVPVTAIWRPLVKAMLAPRAGTGLVLALDPTPHGPRRSVIVLGLVAHKRVLPLAWHIVPSQESWPLPQQTCLRRICRLVAGWLPPGCAVTLVADSGLASRDLAKLCESLGWRYVLRLSADARQGCVVRLPGGAERPVWELVEESGGKGRARWYGRVECFKRGGWIPVELTIYWGAGYREPWVLVSAGRAGLARVREYRRRHHAEATFQDCKKRGWDVERSGVSDANRLNRLLLALFVALWWAESLGARVVRRGLRRRYDRNDRRDLSLARLGRRWIADLLSRGRPHPLLFRYHDDAWRSAWLL